MESAQSEQQQQLVGGEVEIADSDIASVSDTQVREALSAVTDRYNMMVNSMYRLIPTGGKVTRQTVNGILFRFTGLEFKTTTVRNNSEAMGKFTVEECPLNEAITASNAKATAEVFWDRETFEIKKLEPTG